MFQLNEHHKGAHPNRFANGHVTVEAALLIPLVIIVVVGSTQQPCWANVEQPCKLSSKEPLSLVLN